MPEQFHGLPKDLPALSELMARPQWVAWKYEDRGGAKPTKPPVSPRSGFGANSSDPRTWAPYPEAAQFALRKQLPGVGYVLSSNDEYTGIDLDNCIGQDGDLEPWAAEIVALKETYCEVSPSGHGLRLIARGKIDRPVKSNDAHVELYGDKRYLTITGTHYEGSPTEIRPAPLTIERLVARAERMKSATPTPASEPQTAKLGTDFFANVNKRALECLSLWVPSIFPTARLQQGTGAYRISSRDLGRDLQEDLSIAPNGIKDWGVHDMGDARDGARSAIDICIEHGNHADARSAAFWLCGRMGTSPENMGWTDIPAVLDDGYDPNILLESFLARRPLAEAVDPSDFLTPASSFAALPMPIREFLDERQLIPMRNVTMLSGDGGTGKSLLAMQLAAAVTTGTKWLGQRIRMGPVVYFSAEDDEAETHIRLKDICAAEKLDLDVMHKLGIAIMAGKDAVLAVEEPRLSRMKETQLWKVLTAAVGAEQPALVILDNLADIFAGNENSRPLARQFVGMLRGLAIETGCAIVLLSHPSVAGMSSGTGTSGNTAWSNSVRSRLYLRRNYIQTDDKGRLEEDDPNLRILETKKANYGQIGGEVRVRWEGGRFIAVDEPRVDSGDLVAQSSKAERVFMQLLRWHLQRDKFVSPNKSVSWAPKVFSRHPQAEGVTTRQFETAMTILLDQRRIEIYTHGQPASRRQHIGLPIGQSAHDD